MLAITDHDTTEGLPAALAEAQRWDITVVPGVEISTITERQEIHLLGYFVDLDDADLQPVTKTEVDIWLPWLKRVNRRLAEEIWWHVHQWDECYCGHDRKDHQGHGEDGRCSRCKCENFLLADRL